ncbi:hypothetical protein PLESTB_000040600 [Pleodorina starrii]|uniref:Uncharacterized protein n=1 Tax=Pleodorina starrii TaxID=330485 RepID=A0A9W6B986_9CHLO|nr:hypothetical protein PLESTB_000040600 [Pleodorina starrii]
MPLQTFALKTAPTAAGQHKQASLPSVAKSLGLWPHQRCAGQDVRAWAGNGRRDVHIMPMTVIIVSKESSKGGKMFADELFDKVSRYTSVRINAIKPNPRNSQIPEEQRVAEGQKVLKAIEGRDYVVVLDERGQELSSEGLADLVAAAGDVNRPLVFCIGGPYGHSDAVRGRADRMVRLSSMVLNHQVALVVLLEQLYRACTILRGVPYHH